MWHAQLQGHGVCVLFFCRVVWIFYRFLAGFPCCRDLLIRCKRVVSIYHCCFVLFHPVVDSGVKKYSQNKWHLAAKLGTKLANLL